MTNIGQYGLLVLKKLLKKATSYDELKRLIQTYPEDRHVEGRVVEDMAKAIKPFSTLELINAAADKKAQEYGGWESLNDFSESMDRHAEMSGYYD
jgi:hypothetical protein